jgi:hypothetical protein
MTDTDDLRAKAQRVIDRDGDVYCPEGDALARYVLARLEEPRGAGVTHEAAGDALNRFIASHFDDANAEHARISIPARPDRDDDLLLVAYIEQQAQRDGEHADLERRARALCKAIADLESGRFGWEHEDVVALGKRLADVLGEERSGSAEGGGDAKS